MAVNHFAYFLVLYFPDPNPHVRGHRQAMYHVVGEVAVPDPAIVARENSKRIVDTLRQIVDPNLARSIGAACC